MELSGIELHYLVNKISPKVSSGYYVSSISSITKNSILLKLHHPAEPRYHAYGVDQRDMVYK